MTDTLIIHPFKPIYDADSRVLILGSFPSVVSRRKSFYYANSSNRFWSLMESIYQDSAGDDKEAFCHRHHIALWDVIHSCTIHGSSDSSIRNAVVNDIGALIKGTKIHIVFTTGGKASQLYDKYIHLPLSHVPLPSTSSANARMKIEDLKKYYEEIRYETEKD